MEMKEERWETEEERGDRRESWEMETTRKLET